jgi:hypothetical protein
MNVTRLIEPISLYTSRTYTERAKSLVRGSGAILWEWTEEAILNGETSLPIESIGGSGNEIAATYPLLDALRCANLPAGAQSTVGSTKCEVIGTYIVPIQ